MLLERKSRVYLAMPISSKKAEEVTKVWQGILQNLGTHFNDVFKTLTLDNGAEFSEMTNLESISDTLVYFAHPYSPQEKGAIENANGLLRRLLPRGSRVDTLTTEQIESMMNWMNNLPRKSLHYQTPLEVFQHELQDVWESC